MLEVRPRDMPEITRTGGAQRRVGSPHRRRGVVVLTWIRRSPYLDFNSVQVPRQFFTFWSFHAALLLECLALESEVSGLHKADRAKVAFLSVNKVEQQSLGNQFVISCFSLLARYSGDFHGSKTRAGADANRCNML